MYEEESSCSTFIKANPDKRASAMMNVCSTSSSVRVTLGQNTRPQSFEKHFSLIIENIAAACQEVEGAWLPC